MPSDSLPVRKYRPNCHAYISSARFRSGFHPAAETNIFLCRPVWKSAPRQAPKPSAELSAAASAAIVRKDSSFRHTYEPASDASMRTAARHDTAFLRDFAKNAPAAGLSSILYLYLQMPDL